MAGRILNRRELRKQADEAEARESAQAPEADDEVDDAGEADLAEDKRSRPAKAKAPAAKARKPRKPKVAPRMRVRWGVFDGSMKQVAIFDYNQRAAADEKAAELAAKKNSPFFLQMVKEPMPEPVPETSQAQRPSEPPSRRGRVRATGPAPRMGERPSLSGVTEE